MKFAKDYVKEQMISAFNGEKFLSKCTVRLNLLKEDPEDIADEMLRYAIEINLLRIDGDYYELNI